MKDLIPLGNGNSRFLKSSIPEDITFEEFVQLFREGKFPVDFNGINPEGISQMGSAYNVANVLPEDVCNVLRINTEISEPRDAFLEIGQYNQYWWRRRLVGSGYVESLGEVTRVEILVASDNLGSSPIIIYDSITVNPSTGAITTNNAQSTLTRPSSSFTSTWTSKLAGKYFRADPRSSTAQDAPLYYCPKQPNIVQEEGSGGSYFGYTDAQLVGTKYVSSGDWEYLRSSNIDAYPHTGTVDSLEYVFLGVPFENAVKAVPNTLSKYAGTGAATFSLQFDSPPSLVVIEGYIRSTYFGTIDATIPGSAYMGTSRFSLNWINDSGNDYGVYAQWDASGTTLTFSSAANLNSSGNVYLYHYLV